MFTGDVVMYDDSNLNKNEFTALVSFAVNFRIFHAQLVLPDPACHCVGDGGGGSFQARGGQGTQKPAAPNGLPERSSHWLLKKSLFTCFPR